jgi:glycosyltransferase involved in cell wall biosynthesis
MRAGRLRVLEVIAASGVGGAERVVAALVKGLDRRRFDVRVVCHGSGPLSETYRRHAAGLVSLDLLHVGNPGTVWRLARLMRSLSCDVVHTHLWTADLLGGLAATLAAVPVRVATVHGGYFQSVHARGVRRARKRILSGTYRTVYRLFDRVVAVARSVADDLATRPGYRVDSGRVRIIPNGLDLTRLPPAGERVDRAAWGLPATAPVVVQVANFYPPKGHRWLVRAMPRIVACHPEAVFVLAGEGPELPGIRGEVARLGLAAHVRFVGADADALALLGASDVVVVPSESEGLPLALLEALALARPVVATAVGGIPDVIEPGRTGILTPPCDPDALADAVCAVLGDPGRARAIGEAGRSTVRARYAAERMVAETEALYVELARGKRLPGTDGAGAAP